ncbi:MAG: MmcQ/YjbR family DNA-binding protein [Oceanospirillaceae bacterium]|nr:MmcQ/YjbR family DNA-binding protein [Oceanospirillaceae bacterium]
MDTQLLQAFCHSFPGVVAHESDNAANVLTHKIQGKKFAYFKTSEPEQWRFSIRTYSDRFLELTDQPGIKPAKYMHRFHWVTIVNVGSIDERYLKELVTWSYEKALSSLSKKMQATIKA